MQQPGHLAWWMHHLMSDEVVDNLDYRALMTCNHQYFSPRTTEADIWQVREFSRYLAQMTRFRL